MSWHPLLPWPFVVLPGLLLVGFTAWRVVADTHHRLRWGLRLATAVAMVLTLLGPAVDGAIARQAASDVNVYFVVDTTTSAMARDHDGDRTRIEGYREDMAKIQEEMPGARFSIITFDYAARVVMPLTTDTNALKTAAENLRAENSLYSGGSSITAAQERLRLTLEGAKERQPERSRIVFYLGDGEQTSSQDPTPFDLPDLVDGGAVLGYGTEQGGRMASTDADGEPGEDIKDSQGNPGVSKIDEKRLEEIAEQLGVPYTHREGGDIGPALTDADPGEAVDGEGAGIETYTSLVWVLALIMSGLLLADLFVTTREIGRLRRVEAEAGGTP
ncbi:vWA domain-containing protein [Janibacter sp. G368]|uniref:vWA domain-containing protein n=1 Tax=Janibacter sp. G368 TaxID=3420441 RepID=UPI003CFCF68C